MEIGGQSAGSPDSILPGHAQEVSACPVASVRDGQRRGEVANKDANASRLTNYLDLHAQRLRVDLQAARLFVGTTDVGNVAENAVRRFLQSNLPARYSVGVGEAIAPDGQSPRRVQQTQQKDVVIYDAYGCAVLGWNECGVSLFPVESIYGVIEVKTSISSANSLLKAVQQTVEVKELCRTGRNAEQVSPFTGVFAFESEVEGDTLFDALKQRAPAERADFVLVLNPKRSDVSNQNTSFYFAHRRYHARGGGGIDFVSADQAAPAPSDSAASADTFLTFGDTDKAVLWFYLFLTAQLNGMQLRGPDLWDYAKASKERLGWRDNE